MLTNMVPKYGVLASWCNFPIILKVAQIKRQHLLHKKALLPGVILLIQEENRERKTSNMKTKAISLFHSIKHPQTVQCIFPILVNGLSEHIPILQPVLH